MVLPFKVQPATISSIGQAMVPVDTTKTAPKEVVFTKVVAGCIVKEAWDLVVLVLKVDNAVVWDRELKALACTDKVAEMDPWEEVATLAAVLVVALWVVEGVDHKIVLSNKAAVVVVEMVAVAVLEILKFT